MVLLDPDSTAVTLQLATLASSFRSPSLSLLLRSFGMSAPSSASSPQQQERLNVLFKEADAARLRAIQRGDCSPAEIRKYEWYTGTQVDDQYCNPPMTAAFKQCIADRMKRRRRRTRLWQEPTPHEMRAFCEFVWDSLVFCDNRRASVSGKDMAAAYATYLQRRPNAARLSPTTFRHCTRAVFGVGSRVRCYGVVRA
jgi:hypothetical protein